MMMLKCLFLLVMISQFSCVAAKDIKLGKNGSPDPYANETKEQRDARMHWWREAKFGMFIHWGVYAVPAGTYEGKQIGSIGEWIMSNGKIPCSVYQEYAKQFNPVKYNPDAWVKAAKAAGMKYIVITSKHHDGFALFNSKVTKWDVVDATPYGKDLLKPLAEACRKNGMKLGFYYSQAQDWNHSGGAAMNGHWDKAQEGSMAEYIKNIAVPQVKEILSNYGDIAVLWWDTETGMNKELAEPLIAQLRLQPGIIHNNRLGGGFEGDTETPEQFIPATGFKDRDWETCMTMNDTWGFKSYDHNWKSMQMLLRNLVNIASKGGNYLLNVGPTAEGEIPQPSLDRLKEIGKWMEVNGESIYGTIASPCKAPAWGRLTRKENKTGGPMTLYMHVFKWPENGRLLLSLDCNLESAKMLADAGRKITWEKSDNGLVFNVGENPADPFDTVIAVQCTGKMIPIEVVTVVQPDADGTLVLKASDAFLVGSDISVDEAEDIPMICNWTNLNDSAVWNTTSVAPRKYDVELDYSALGGNKKTAVELTVGTDSLASELEPTGGWDKFKSLKIGSVEIKPSAALTVTLKATQKSRLRALNLRSVKLSPADS